MGIFTKNEESRKYFESLSDFDQEQLATKQMAFLHQAQDEWAMSTMSLKTLIDQATSLYRCPENNRKEGGSPKSRHLTGTAGDWPAGTFPALKNGTRDKMGKHDWWAWYHFSNLNGDRFIHLENRGI